MFMGKRKTKDKQIEFGYLNRTTEDKRRQSTLPLT